MKKLLLVFGIFLLVATFVASPANFSNGETLAAKIKAKPQKDLEISYILSSDKKIITIYFHNLSNIKHINWQLLYRGDKNLQAAMGGNNIAVGQTTSTTAEIVFGTCSQGVCTYYGDVKNVRLKTFVEVRTGKNYQKKFPIDID